MESRGTGRSWLVCLRVRRTVDRPLRVVIPVGTFFDCRGSAQNMIATASSTIDLNDEWQILLVFAAYWGRVG